MNKTQAMQTLMLDSDATFGDIKYAYRKLSLKLHPDKNKNEKNDKRFKNVLEAYHFLKGQNRLKNYNDRNKSTQKKSSYNDRQHNPGEDWSRFTKDFEMDENFWRQYEKSFWKIMNLEPRKNLERMTLEKRFGMKAKKVLIQNPKRNTRITKITSMSIIYLWT